GRVRRERVRCALDIEPLLGVRRPAVPDDLVRSPDDPEPPDVVRRGVPLDRAAGDVELEAFASVVNGGVVREDVLRTRDVEPDADTVFHGQAFELVPRALGR